MKVSRLLGLCITSAVFAFFLSFVVAFAETR